MARFGRRNVVVAAVATAVFLAVIGIAFFLVQSAHFQRWARNDAGTLAPYPFTLFPTLADGGADREKDEALLANMTAGRLVVSMTRSDYHRSLTSGGTWVKVHLITSKPGEERTQIQIKLLAQMMQVGGAWTVTNVEQLAMP